MNKENDFFCKNKYNNKGRFIEACLLCLLKEKKDYGYGLVERLKDFNFDQNSINMSIIYRNLNNMEDENLVLSSWEKSEEGPDRKIYKITYKGEEALDKWILLIKDRKKRIESIICKYENLK